MRGRRGLFAIAALVLLVLVAGGLVFSDAKPPMTATFEGDKDNASAAPQSKPAAGGAESTDQAGNQPESDPQVAEHEAPEKQETSGQPAAQPAGEQAPAKERIAAEQQYAEQRAAPVERAAEQAAAPRDTGMGLTIPKIGLYDAPVTDSIAESVLANGAGKIPSTGFPWQPGANTYIAGHVYGYPGTGSWQLFAGLPSLVAGDQISLTDSSGTTYEYRVTEVLVVAPTDVWVAQPTGQNMVSLQTCVGPGWSERLVVRAVMV
jgi:sortase A